MRFSLQTNGVLLTDELAAFIAGTGRCDNIKLSIDGPEDIHDAQRGKGAFAGAVQALELLKKHHLKVDCVMTVHKDNLPLFESCVEYLLNELKVPRLSFSLATAASGTPPHLALNADDFYNWVMHSKVIEARYGKERFGRGGAAPVLGFWRGLHARLNKKPERNLYGHCAKIHTALSVRHDGAIVPCQKISDKVLGFAGKESLAAIWNKSPELLKLRSFPENPEYREMCADCPYREWCSAGCPAHPDIMEDCGIGCLKEYLKRGGEL
jgi:radical SAM protein with 4Fe4S-binding SPASM domain